VIVLRREVGDVLRSHRQAQGRTLREISASAAVSLGYLSEVERARRKPLGVARSICGALNLPMSQMLSDVSERAASPRPQCPANLQSTAYRNLVEPPPLTLSQTQT